MELANVEKVSFSSTVFGKKESLNSQEIDGKVVNFASLWVDANFIDLYDLKLLKGRLFSEKFISDMNATALLNESAVKEFDIEDPFQVKIGVPGGQAQVVGIVRDFNFKSLHNSIEPMAIVYLPRQGGYVNIEISGSNPLQTLDRIGEVWDDLAPGFPFNYQFLDLSLEMLYKQDEKMGQAILYFSVLAITIAILGIFSLSLFMCEKRVKELGIHKIYGAKSWNLQLLLNKNFIIILVVSFLLACPVAWYLMNRWLDKFSYKADIGIWVFLVSGFLVSIVTLIVAGWQSWRFTRRNPVEVLRYE